ncbi:hypothetical protein LCGC14_2277260 [marine sediment metagenome]|uniref:Uncharacterized protein n=1 Tax=marine sediment metagenome TaxID=412755 RepID=A0A0F9CVG9_9ZZZZ
MMEKKYPKIPAMIVEIPVRQNGWSYVLIVKGKGRVYLCGRGAPSPGRVGEKGTVQYTVGPNYGLFFWEGRR